jgi:5-methyltetrahydrofolate--homocysteine methyltransferase
MGTMLFQAGLEQGEPPDKWNLEHPEKVAAVHRGYLEAGAQLLLTNTFGANRYRLKLHNLHDRVAEINRKAVEILRAEIEAAGGTALAAGDIGPTGEVLLPYGELAFEEARAAFEEQARALIEAGVDLIWIETLSDLEEMRAAVEGVRQVSPDIPIIATMTFDTHGRTMMGVTPEQAAKALVEMGVDAIGANCGNGPDETMLAVQKMATAVQGIPLVAKANAGIPRLEKGKPVYDADPPAMAEYALQVRQAGAQLIGACCGSTPDHLRAMARALQAAREKL